MRNATLTMIKICVVLIFTIVQACESQSKDESKLIGEWLEYKIEKFDASPSKFDFWGDGDTLGIINAVKHHFEFSRNGKGREMSFIPDEIVPFSYKVKESEIQIDNTKYIIEKITADTLILLVPDSKSIGYIDHDPRTPYQERIHFKKVDRKNR